MRVGGWEHGVAMSTHVRATYVIAVPQKNDQYFPQSSDQSSYKKSQRTIAPTTPRTVVTLMIMSSENI
jgi:hypothetical protein